MTVRGGSCVARAIELLRLARIVVIDVDSTIIRREGLDMLARYRNREKDITELKRQYWMVVLPLD